MKSNEELVDYLLAKGVIKSREIERAFRAVDRGEFVLPEYRRYAYVDDALPHLSGQSISQPSVVAVMLELLEPKAGLIAVEVGSGSGYVLALLSELCKGVYGFEVREKIFKFSLTRLWQRKNVTNVLYNPVGGLEGLEFQRLLISAEARNFPEALINSLEPGGIAVFPYRNSLYRVVRTEGGFEVTDVLPGYIFVPLMEV